MQSPLARCEPGQSGRRSSNRFVHCFIAEKGRPRRAAPTIQIPYYKSLKLVFVVFDRIVDIDVAAVVRLQLFAGLEANRLA